MEEEIEQDSETVIDTQIQSSDAENPDAENQDNANISNDSDTASDAKHPRLYILLDLLFVVKKAFLGRVARVC